MKNDVPQNRGEIGFDHPSQDKKSVDLTPVLREVNFAKNDLPQSRGEIFTAILVLVRRATVPSGSVSFLKPTFYRARTP